ncbi:Glutamate--tRNA ligase [Mycoplasmoides gallisepticum]|nr:Glutamate--tRNA ligase [Mycoplasmoides gallisepticum]
MDDVMYLAFIKPYVDLNEYDEIKTKVNEICLMFKNQLQYGYQINEIIKESFVPHVGLSNLDQADLDFLKSNPNYRQLLISFKEKINQLDQVNDHNVKEIINWLAHQIKLGDLVLEKPLGGKNLYMPLRIVLSNKKHGPELNKVIALYDKQTILKNLDDAINYLTNAK